MGVGWCVGSGEEKEMINKCEGKLLVCEMMWSNSWLCKGDKMDVSVR